MLLSLIIGPYLPFLVGLSREDVRRMFPYMEKNVWNILKESGYMHIQATKPDTAGGEIHNQETSSVILIIFTLRISQNELTQSIYEKCPETSQCYKYFVISVFLIPLSP